MFEQVYPTTEAVVGRVINFAQRRAWFVIVFALGAAIATAQYTATHFAINTNTEEMLSERLPWRVTFSDYKKDFPYFSDTIVIVIDGATPDTAQRNWPIDCAKRNLWYAVFTIRLAVIFCVITNCYTSITMT